MVAGRWWRGVASNIAESRSPSFRSSLPPVERAELYVAQRAPDLPVVTEDVVLFRYVLATAGIGTPVLSHEHLPVFLSLDG